MNTTMTEAPTRSSQQRQEQGQNNTTLAVEGIAPEQIKGVLLADGWHTVSGCQLTAFAVAERRSPPSPSKLYSGIKFFDQKNNRNITVPFGAILGYEVSESQTS